LPIGVRRRTFSQGSDGDSYRHRQDLTKLQIRTRSGRNTALLALARDVPPMVLCDLLGVGSY